MRAEALKIDREALLEQTLRGRVSRPARSVRAVRRPLRAETLVPALDRLEAGVRARTFTSPASAPSSSRSCVPGVGRPTPLTLARELSRRWGAEVWLKREDLATRGRTRSTTRSARRCSRSASGRGASSRRRARGQHGVATAAACARLGLPCVVYMGSVDMERQAPNVGRMKLLGAEVVPVTSGDQTLRAPRSTRPCATGCRIPTAPTT